MVSLEIWVIWSDTDIPKGKTIESWRYDEGNKNWTDVAANQSMLEIAVYHPQLQSDNEGFYSESWRKKDTGHLDFSSKCQNL